MIFPRVKRYLGGLLLVLLGAAALWGTLALERATRVNFAELNPRPGPLVLDRTGRILRLALGPQGMRAVLLPEGDLPPMVSAAFLAAEDQRFFQHPGVDLVAVFRAAGQNLLAGRITSGPPPSPCNWPASSPPAPGPSGASWWKPAEV